MKAKCCFSAARRTTRDAWFDFGDDEADECRTPECLANLWYLPTLAAIDLGYIFFGFALIFGLSYYFVYFQIVQVVTLRGWDVCTALFLLRQF
jgi:hypothetical protein